MDIYHIDGWYITEIISEHGEWVKAEDALKLESSLAKVTVQRDALEEALKKVEKILLDLPSGIDYDADEKNESPEDMMPHIGGLAIKAIHKALALCEKED